MRNKHGTTHITPADGNIFLDLGHDPKTAAKMLAETDRAIERKLALNPKLIDTTQPEIGAGCKSRTRCG